MGKINFKRILKFLGWWYIFSSFYAMFSVCPFCGKQGCPVGAASAGLVGGFFTFLMQNLKNFVEKLKIGFINVKTKIFKNVK
jgi:hypothetical protein